MAQAQAQIQVAQTLRAVVIACGVPDDQVQYANQDKPDRVVDEVFAGDFEACLMMTPEDVDDALKSLAQLPSNDGRSTLFLVLVLWLAIIKSVQYPIELP